MSVKLQTEHYLEFLSLKEAAQARLSLHMSKLPHCWKSRVVAHLLIVGGKRRTFRLLRMYILGKSVPDLHLRLLSCRPRVTVT